MFLLSAFICSEISQAQCKVAGHDIFPANSSLAVGLPQKRGAIVVDTTAVLLGCTVRIVAWDIRYSGQCPIIFQVWRKLEIQDVYELVGQNNATLSSSSETVSRIQIPSIGEQIVIQETVFLGLTIHNESCKVVAYNGTSENRLIFYQGSSVGHLTRLVGENTTFDSFDSVSRFAAFRALLAGEY